MTHLDAARIDHHHATGTITDREQQALHLRYVKNLSYRQISLGLGLATSTVADRVRRAHQKITLAERTPT